MNQPVESKHEVDSVEAAIQTAKDRLESLQAANACEENARAAAYLTKALRQCDMRTQRLKAEAAAAEATVTAKAEAQAEADRIIADAKEKAAKIEADAKAAAEQAAADASEPAETEGTHAP